MIAADFPAFDEQAFVKRALKGYDALRADAAWPEIAKSLMRR